MLILGGISKAKAVFLDFPDIEVRKRGDQKGLDTPVVHAVNDDHSLLEQYYVSVSELTR